jgi:hypothetical protein
MRPTTRRATWTALFLLTSALAAPALAGECHAVHAEIDLGAGTIAGNFGLVGTVAFASDGTGTAPPTAPPAASVFSGILTITTARGDLVLRETGMFSSRSGSPRGAVLASWGDFESGTGRYAGITGGDLFFVGTNAGGSLQLDVTGELCGD